MYSVSQCTEIFITHILSQAKNKTFKLMFKHITFQQPYKICILHMNKIHKKQRKLWMSKWPIAR